MTLLDDFLNTDSVRLPSVSLTFRAPRILVPDGPAVGPIPDGPLSVGVPCIPKSRGRLDATLSILDLRVPLTGVFLGVDGRGRWMFRWSVDDRTPRRLAGQTVERVRGQVTVEVLALAMLVTDVASCTGAEAEYFLEVRSVPLDDQDPTSRPLPNELEIFPAGAFPALASDLAFTGTAGVAAPAVPRPRATQVVIQSCVPWSPSPRTVSGSVVLSGPVRRSHADLRATVMAEAIDPLTVTLPVRTGPAVGSSVPFTITVPSGYSGRVRVWAFTDRREDRAQTELLVPPPDGLGCGLPQEAEYYEVLQVGCEAYDCGWTGLNDRADLVGRMGDDAARYLVSRSVVDLFGRGVPGLLQARAINVHGQVLAGFADQSGRQGSAMYGEPMHDDDTGKAGEGAGPELRVVEGAVLVALNDAGMAAGSLPLKDGSATAVVWVDGELRRLDIPGIASTATDLNERGQVVGVYAEQSGKGIRSFFAEDGKVRDLGDLGGIATLASAINGAGTVVGASQGKDGLLQAFTVAPGQNLMAIEPPDGYASAVAVDVNDAGEVIGTAWSPKSGASCAFRWTAERGTETFDALADVKHEVMVLSAVSVNNLGQVLVQALSGEVIGTYLLNPASIPTPQVPIP